MDVLSGVGDTDLNRSVQAVGPAYAALSEDVSLSHSFRGDYLPGSQPRAQICISRGRNREVAQQDGRETLRPRTMEQQNRNDSAVSGSAMVTGNNRLPADLGVAIWRLYSSMHRDWQMRVIIWRITWPQAIAYSGVLRRSPLVELFLIYPSGVFHV